MQQASTTREVDGPGAGDDGPPAAGEGGTCCLCTSWGELAISVPRHRHPRATITAGRMGHAGLHTRHRRVAPVRAQRGTQPRPPKAPCEATTVKTAWARTSPHLQQCDRGVDGQGAGDDGPPAASEGGHVACAPAAAARIPPCAWTLDATPGSSRHTGQTAVSAVSTARAYCRSPSTPVPR